MKRRAALAGTVVATGALCGLHAAPVAAAEPGPGIMVLPKPGIDGVPLEQALARRRSVRGYTAEPVALVALSQLLWAAQGITASEGRRTAPSAGALYPLELHIVAVRVDGLAFGAYRYLPAEHALQRRIEGNVAPAMARAAFGQAAVGEGAAVVAITAVQARTAAKYAERAPRFVAFEAGAAAQNLALQAAGLGLATVVIGAFDDDAVARVLGLDPTERALALMPVGPPRPSKA